MNDVGNGEDFRLYTVEEVAELIGVSARWLADGCRAERIEHVHIARKRRFTEQQVAQLLTTYTVRPSEVREVDVARDRVLRRLERARSRR